jgi:serine/threonine protein kinase
MNLETICINCMEDDSGNPVCPKCGAPFDLTVNNMLVLPPRIVLRDQYLIGRALGHGGFGITYLAWDIGLQTRLAVKEYMPNGVAGRVDRTKVQPFSDKSQPEYEWGLDRFLEEARVLKKSHHPNIVSVDTVFRDNGTAYLVMEYLEGLTFEDFLRRRGGTVTFEDALRVMLPVMDALSAVHAESVVHRDVSPDNIYVLKTGYVKLIDFGAARNALRQKSGSLSVILKGGYAPEEQYRSSGQQGAWTDVYATAATLYRAITGKIPPASLDRQATDTMEVPSKLGVAIPPSAESALIKALAVRAGDRFQAIEDFKSALTGGMAIPRATRIALPEEVRRPAAMTAAAAASAPQSTPAPPPPPAPLQATETLSRLETFMQKYENASATVEEPPAETPAAVVREPRVRTPLPKWLVPGILAGVVVLASVGILRWYLHRPSAKSTSTVKEWPAQPAGIPQRDEERQRLLEAQARQQPNPTPAPPATEPQPAALPVVAKQAPASPSPPSVASHTEPQPQQTPVATVPAIPETPAPPPTVAKPPVSAPSYSDMLKQAEDMIANKRYTQAQTQLNDAIKANPGNSEAYNSIAKLELYFLNLPAQAFDHYRTALAKGGVATFRVTYEHGEGWLSVSTAKAAFKADDGAHSFDASAVKEAKKNKAGMVKLGKGRHAFHIRLANDANYNFEPGSQSPGEEVDFILKVIGS